MHYTQSNRNNAQPNCPYAQFAHTPIGETYGWVATVAPRAEEEAFRSGLYYCIKSVGLCSVEISILWTTPSSDDHRPVRHFGHCSHQLLPNATGRQLDGTQLHLPHRWNFARTATPLHHCGSIHRSTGPAAAWHRQLRRQLSHAIFRGRTVRTGPTTGRDKVLHHSTRFPRSWKVVQAVGRSARQISQVHLFSCKSLKYSVIQSINSILQLIDKYHSILILIKFYFQ